MRNISSCFVSMVTLFNYTTCCVPIYSTFMPYRISAVICRWPGWKSYGYCTATIIIFYSTCNSIAFFCNINNFNIFYYGWFCISYNNSRSPPCCHISIHIICIYVRKIQSSFISMITFLNYTTCRISINRAIMPYRISTIIC